MTAEGLRETLSSTFGMQQKPEVWGVAHEVGVVADGAGGPGQAVIGRCVPAGRGDDRVGSRQDLRGSHDYIISNICQCASSVCVSP
jgi:hypothetical protein